MKMHSKNELTEIVASRYQKATKREKGLILDEFCQNTEFDRKYAIRKLKYELGYPYRERKKEKRKRHKPSRYAIIKGLVKYLWETIDYPSGTRLKAAIPELLKKADLYEELPIIQEQVELLFEVSPATLDRMLQDDRRKQCKRFNCQTRPSKAKSRIPFACDQDKVDSPGILEIDLVAHCGSCAMGPFVNTLSTTDFISGWQESEAIMGKSQQAVKEALLCIKLRLPFPLRGIDFDSGSEFVNETIWNLAQEMRISLSRSRPYQKNDNAHIEQKNWMNVRKQIGYLRLDTPQAQALLNDLYRHELRLFINFFLPSAMLISKERIGSKVKKKYDTPKTPYRRLLDRCDIDESIKVDLRKLYDSLNPFELKRVIEAKLYRLLSLSKKDAA